MKYTLVTSKRGVHVSTTTHPTTHAARKAYDAASKSGKVDQGSTFIDGSDVPVSYYQG